MLLAGLAAEGKQRREVLGKTAAPVPAPGLQVRKNARPYGLAVDDRAEPSIAVHDPEHVLDIDIRQRLRDPPDLVREGDQRGEERIRGVLRELGRSRLGEDHWGSQRLVEAAQQLATVIVAAADDDAIRMKTVLDGGALPQELGIRGDGRVSVRKERGDSPVHGAGDDGAPDRHDSAGRPAGEPGDEIRGRVSQVRQVDTARRLGGCLDSQEYDLRLRRPCDLARDLEATGFQFAGEELRKPRFVKRWRAAGDGLAPNVVALDSHNTMAG